jgi:cephalosporin-C deacetylase
VKGTTWKGHIIRGLEEAPDNLLYRHIFLDTAELARIVMDMPDVDPDRVGATGGSQGGGLTIACAALEPRIRRAFPVFPFLSDYRRVWEMDLAKRAYEELTWYFRSFDPLHSREEQIFTQLGYIDIQHLAARIKAQTRMALGLMDEVCPPSSQFAAYNKMTCPKDLLIYPDFGHEELRGIEDQVYEFMAAL